MATLVQQHVVRLDVAVHDALLVDVSKGATELGHPEPYRFLGEGFARDMEAEVPTVHEIHDDVPGSVSRPSAEPRQHHVQVLDVLKAVPKIAQERMVQMLEHAPLADDVSHALRSDDCHATAVSMLTVVERPGLFPTFIFADVFESKGQAGVLAFDDADLAKRPFTDDP